MVVQYQPLRVRLIQLLRSRPTIAWVLECMMVIMSCLPAGAADPDTDQHLSCRALVAGFLAQLQEPVPEPATGAATEEEEDRIELHFEVGQRQIELSFL